MDLSYILVLFITGLIWTVFFLIFSNLRRELILTGLLIAPLAFVDYFATPEYWTPVTILNIPIGIEGIIFTFFISGIASIIYEIVTSRKLNKRKPPIKWDKIKYFLVPTILSFLAWILIKFNFIYFVNLVLISNGLLILFLRKDLIQNALISSFLFASIYTVSFSLWIYLTPLAINWWNSVNLSGIRLGVVPLEEILFALSFGFFVGPIFEFLTNSKDM